MSLPPFVYVKKFWEAVSYFLAGVLGLLAIFGVVSPEWALGAGAILAWILGFLRFFGIEPTFRTWSWSAKVKKLLGR